MNRRSIFTTSFVAAATVAIVGISAVSAADGRPSHPNDNSEVAAYVTARHLLVSGLSPASLRPVEVSRASDLADIAQWARENGLSGLSPASLRPVDD